METLLLAGLAVALVSCAVLHVRLSAQAKSHRELVAQIQWIHDYEAGNGKAAPAPDGDLLWDQSADWVASSRANRGW